MSNDESDMKDLTEEVREGFDLISDLQGRSFRTDTIRLYTDEVTAEELGDVREEEETGAFGIVVGKKRVREGILGEIDEIKDDPDQADRLAELEARAAELRAKLDETAYEVTLRTVPDLIEEKAKREAKKQLGIKGNVPEDRASEYGQAFTARLLAVIITSFKKLQTGEAKARLTVTETQALKDFLPKSEYARLDAKVAEIQYKKVIGDQIVSDASFSRAG